MKEIKLTQGKVALVDDEDFEYINQWRWYAHREFKIYYALRAICDNGKKRRIAMHREILKTPNDMVVDHIDGDGLNNQKSNLRNCTQSQNKTNRRSYGTSKYLGVSIWMGKYIRAEIQTNNKRISLGMFNTEEEAARAYDEAAKKYHGEFANLNFK